MTGGQCSTCVITGGKEEGGGGREEEEEHCCKRELVPSTELFLQCSFPTDIESSTN